MKGKYNTQSELLEIRAPRKITVWTKYLEK